MTETPMVTLLMSLRERAKELNCIYRVEEILGEFDRTVEQVCLEIIDCIPPGWQFPDICMAKIVIDDTVYRRESFEETIWFQCADILANGVPIGKIWVYYTKEVPNADDGPFLREEAKLIQTIAERLGHFIAHQKMRDIINVWESKGGNDLENRYEWQIVIKMLKQTDAKLFDAISRKMLNYLCWQGVPGAEELLLSYSDHDAFPASDNPDNWNQPSTNNHAKAPKGLGSVIFQKAADALDKEEILNLIKKWIQEDKLSFLIQVVNRNLNLSDVTDAIRRYYHLTESGGSSPNAKGVLVSLIRRILSDQLDYIKMIKDYIGIRDFYHLFKRVVFSAESHGRIGGKSAGLYLASQIIAKNKPKLDVLKNVRIPKSWHITSDVLLHFMRYNNFEEVVEQKYKDIHQVRLEYPYVVKTFKTAPFPPDIAQGLSMALDDFGEVPLIVRSSSLLEDRTGAAFSGKYKSLFLANQGDKHKRLKALTDAIAEVYASTFSPDPIEYRSERGLLDFGEEMGIIIQEVVGNRVGKYFLPAFAGVAFSRNEYRWSPRIKREDGLLRLVPGLGTRAVDRLSDDYPVLISPGQPNLRVNVQPEEIARYSPRKIDAINMETNKFETIELKDFLVDGGVTIPHINKLISIYKDNRIQRQTGLTVDFDPDDVIITFDNLIQDSEFIPQIRSILKILEDAYNNPVDIEFAHDGKNFYLLQCRGQSQSPETRPAPIPKDIPRKNILFSANKHISNGYIPNISHVVYVDPENYALLTDKKDLLTIGRIVSRLNKLLPKRRFILMGPGRWGSRGDIKLGVSVTYSDINNCAALVEIARKRGNYIPDLSFGTHFFQDLVESGIRYIPLYPDSDENIFNESLLKKAPNILPKLLGEYSKYSDVVRLIDLPEYRDGHILNILMNADLDEAVAVIEQPITNIDEYTTPETKLPVESGNFWRWRYDMVERLAADLEPEKYGIVDLYVFGSTKNATAGPGSDIDLLIHFRGNADQKELLHHYLEGWSQSLAEFNYMRTGYKSDGLLDFHFVTDDDIKKKTSYAIKIDAVTDAARKIELKKRII